MSRMDVFQHPRGILHNLRLRTRDFTLLERLFYFPTGTGARLTNSVIRLVSVSDALERLEFLGALSR